MVGEYIGDGTKVAELLSNARTRDCWLAFTFLRTTAMKMITNKAKVVFERENVIISFKFLL